jgi:hypothetical protein
MTCPRSNKLRIWRADVGIRARQSHNFLLKIKN